MDKKDLKTELEKVGQGVKSQLDQHFRQWNSPLQYKIVFSKYSSRASKMGLSISEMSYKLQEMGLINIMSTPSGKRYVFSADCGLDNDSMLSMVLEKEHSEQIEREVNKLKRAQA